MAQLNAIGEMPILIVACKNTSGSDIGSNLVVALTTYVAGQFSIHLPGSDVGAIGVTMEAIANGKVGRVMLQGIASCIASATITSADGTAVVMADSAGKVLPQTAGKFQIGFAMQDAVSTDAVNVFLAPARNA